MIVKTERKRYINMKQIFEKGLSHYASWVLHVGLFVVLMQLCIITACLFLGEHQNQLYAFRLYYAMLEYILLDVALVIGGALLFELAERDVKNKK